MHVWMLILVLEFGSPTEHERLLDASLPSFEACFARGLAELAANPDRTGFRCEPRPLPVS